MIRYKIVWIAACYVLLISGSTVFAEQGPIETIANGCKQELETNCQTVTPGEGRLLACLYAHSDKLSAKCEYALYDAAVQLERAVAALAFVTNECRVDMNQFCSQVQQGQGRLLDCLKNNEKKISDRCNQALMDLDLK